MRTGHMGEDMISWLLWLIVVLKEINEQAEENNIL